MAGLAGGRAAVPPVPSPMPSGGGIGKAWTCTDRTSPSPTAPPLAQPTTVDVKVGQDCAVTGWATPYPTQAVAVTVSHSGGPMTVAGVDGPPQIAVGLHLVGLFMLAGLAVVIAARGR